MMEIWGGLEAFKDIEAEKIADARGRRRAAQRAEARGRGGHASQDDIDSLFA